MPSVRWMNSIPGKLSRGYWPCKWGTIPQAVRWFRETHGTPPRIVVSKRKDWKVVQDVWMWSDQAPTSGQLYFRETYGPVIGDTKYREAVRFALVQVKDEHARRKRNHR